MKAEKGRRRDRPTTSHSHVVTDGKVTHVLVPLDEYEQLKLASLVTEAAATLQDPRTRWMPAGEVGLRLAGRRIAQARKAGGLTQKQLAGDLGVTQSEISRIENNPDRSTIRTLKKIARALDVDVRVLIDPES